MSCRFSMARMPSLSGTNRRQRAGSTLTVLLGLCALTGLGLMAAFLFVLAAHEWPDETQPLLDSRRPLGPGETYTQPLTLSKGGLYRLDIALTRQGVVGGHVILHITADSAGLEKIASAVAPVERTEDLSKQIRRPYTYVDFHFPSEEVIPSGRVWLSLESRASAFIEVRGTEADERGFRAAFKTYYRRTFIDNLAIFAARLNGKSSWVGLVFFLYAMLLTGLSVSIGKITFCDAASFKAGSTGKGDMKPRRGDGITGGNEKRW